MGLILGSVNIHFVHIESVELYLVELIIYGLIVMPNMGNPFPFVLFLSSHYLGASCLDGDSFRMILHIYL